MEYYEEELLELQLALEDLKDDDCEYDVDDGDMF